VVLCSYASNRERLRQIDKTVHRVFRGDWICKTSDMKSWFRVNSYAQLKTILDKLVSHKLISYRRYNHGKLIWYRVMPLWGCCSDGPKIIPCEEKSNFFSVPMSAVTDLVFTDQCSEADILLDLWMNALHCDERVEDSDIDPVVYLRNGTGALALDYPDLAARWGISEECVKKCLAKFENLGCTSTLTLPLQGIVIFLKNYLSSMFKISDVMVDKDELAMSLNMNIFLPEGTTDERSNKYRINVSEELSEISNPRHIEIIVEKVMDFLSAQGIPCSACRESSYTLSLLPVIRKEIKLMRPACTNKLNGRQLVLETHCGLERDSFKFVLTLSKSEV
jgi:hypothetical protein